MSDAPSTRSIYNIGVVQRRTGIKADLIRAWERRYGAVVPERTATDRRLYSDADVRRLTRLRDAVRLGHRIGHIAGLSDQELEDLLEPIRAVEAIEQPAIDLALEDRLASCITAIRSLDAASLMLEFEKASFEMGRLALVEELLVPLMERVGTQWQHGQMDPAYEHLATATIRTFVSSYLASPVTSSAPAIVVTTPVGQVHELGAILAAAMAAATDWRVAYLGTDLPAHSIAEAANRFGSRAVALGITYPDATPDIVAEVETIASSLGGQQLIVGGRGAGRIQAIAEQHSIQIATSMREFRRMITALGQSGPR